MAIDVRALIGERGGAPIDAPAPGRYMTLGLLTSDELARLGLDEPHDWTLAADEIRHIIGRHGDQDREARMGQIAVSTDDLAVLPRALLAGEWREEGDTDTGMPAILHEYEQDGVRYLMVWEVRRRRRMVTLKSMRKRPAPGALRP